MWIYPGPEWLSTIASWSLLQKDEEPLALEIYNIIWGDSVSPLSNSLFWNAYKNNPLTTITGGAITFLQPISPLEWAISGAL